MNRDQQWYEEQYWNWMPTEESYVELWGKRSAEYLAHAQVERNVKYGDGESETLDVFTPSKGTKAPVLIFIHGGYWAWMDKETYAFSLEPIRAAGAVVASINYALCPDNTLSGIVEQVCHACQYVYENIGAHNGDKDNIHVTGHSAGGHLTAMMAATDWRERDANLPLDLIKSAIPSSGIFDMNNIRLTPQLNENIRMDRQEADRNSPLFLDPAYDLPVSVVVGAQETEAFILESEEFTKAWSKKLTTIRYIEIPKVNHFTLIENAVFPGDPFTAVLLDHLHLAS